jgi:hypothetical protein
VNCIRILLVAAVAIAASTAVRAASVVFTVTGQPTLDLLGVTYSVSGGATLDTSGPLPVVTMPVAIFTPQPNNGAVYSLGNSTVTAQFGGDTLEMTDFTLLVFGAVADPQGVLFSDTTLTVNSVSTVLNNFTVGLLTMNLDLVLSPQLTDLLADAGFRGLETVANVTLPAPIPLPGGLALYAGALGLFGAARILRRAARA